MATLGRRILDFVLYSNLFIGCCAGAQVALGYCLLSLPRRMDVVLLVTVSTMMLYSIPQVLGGVRVPDKKGWGKPGWTARNRILHLSALAVAATTFLILLLRLPDLAIMAFLLFGCMALAYYIPLLGRKGHKKGLRSLYGAKVFYIALVWALACCFFPVLVAYAEGWPVRWDAAVWVGIGMFAFLAAITIPFDIRDQTQDRQYGLRTLPILIGARKSRYLSVFLIVLHGLWVIAGSQTIDTRLPLLSVSVLALLLVVGTKDNKSDYFYFLILDGLLLLQFVAVEIGSRLPL